MPTPGAASTPTTHGGRRRGSVLVVVRSCRSTCWFRLSAELTLRRLGPAALIEDNSARSRPATVANLLVRQRWNRLELTGEMLNLLDSRDEDISYFYRSRLRGEPAAGVEDFHTHPLEPRTLRVSLKTRF